MPKQGQYISTPRGYQAFEPSALPVELNLNSEILLLLERANLLVGSLNSLQEVLPSAELLMRPYVIKEALLSSEIEGTQSTLTEVFGEENSVSDDLDIREVQNYERAISFGLSRLFADQFPLSMRLLKEVHAELMRGVRGGEAHKTPGEFRSGQNWIGGHNISDAFYVPCSPETMGEHLSLLEKYFHEDDLPSLIKAALIHYQFETIHPFNDGNGRIGRILITLYLIHKEVLKKPTMYLSLFFKENKSKYYELLTDVRRHGTYEQWIIFFLKGIIEVSQQIQNTTKKIIDLRKNLSATIRDTYKLIDFLFMRPVVRTEDVIKYCNVSRKTGYNIITEFEKNGVLREITSNKRNKKYVFDEYMKILNEKF